MANIRLQWPDLDQSGVEIIVNKESDFLYSFQLRLTKQN